MPYPLITVLMPVFNGEKYLREAMDSILNQTFSDFEFLIINDGSSDRSEEIILDYKDPRIRYLKNENNLRLIATLNKGIELANGKYMVRMDADDISMPDRLEIQYVFMESNPDVGLCGTWFENFSDAGALNTVKYAPDHETICLKHFYQIHLSHGTAIFKTDVLIKNKLLFNPDFAHAEDYELWLRISEVARLANIQKILYRVRRHADEVSEKNSSVQKANSLRVRKTFFNKAGIDISETELLLYQQIAQYEYQKDKGFIISCKNLLEKMFSNAKTASFIKKETLQKNAAQFWFNINYNLTDIGVQVISIYHSSFLHKYHQVNAIDKVKLYFKAIFKV